jgi:PAS domain S-box-containing protein
MIVPARPLVAGLHREEAERTPDEYSQGRYWHSAIKGFLVISLVVSLAGLAVYFTARDSVTLTVTDNLRAIATLKATQVDHWLDEKQNDIRGVMQGELSSQKLDEVLLQWMSGGMHDAVLNARVLGYLQQIRETHQYLDINLRSAQDGRLLLSLDGENDLAATRALALASVRSGNTILEDFHIEDTHGVSKMHVGFINTLRIGTRPQDLIVAEVTLDASEVLFPTIQQWEGWNILAKTHLLRREGNRVVVLNTLHNAADNTHSLGFSSSALASGLAGAVQAEAVRIGSGALRGIDSRDQAVFAYAIPVQHTPWTLVAEVEEGVAYARLNTIAALSSAIVVLLMLSSGWWLRQQHRNTIDRVRHDMERRLLTTRINYLAKYANDCIILCNTSGRITEANDRCLSTYGYSLEEFLQLSLCDIHIPEQQFEVSKLLRQVTREYGVIHESSHVRKDGSTFDVEMSIGLIDIDGHPCCQAIIRDISVRKRLQLEREEHMQHLRDLTCRLVNVQEDERRHLSAELHDQVGANLATMNLNLRTIRKVLANPDPQRLDGLLSETGDLLADSISSIRDYCADLRPAILDYSGLIPALRELLQRHGRRSEIETRFREENLQKRLPPQIESMLFRIAQEALTNCAKHSNARIVEVAIVRQGDTIVMTVSDDGQGFESRLLGARQVGLGLLTMRERAAMAGGRLSVISRPGEGTQIRVVVALGKSRAPAHETGSGMSPAPERDAFPRVCVPNDTLAG